MKPIHNSIAIQTKSNLKPLESVPQLIQAIKDYIKCWNKSGRSFKWTKKPDDILDKIKKAKTI